MTDYEQFLDGNLARSETRLPVGVRQAWAEREYVKRSRRRALAWAVAVCVSLTLWFAIVKALIWLAGYLAVKGL